MNRFRDTVRNATTKLPIAGALVNVYIPDSINHAPIYEDAAGTTPAANPIITDANGDFEFWTQGGWYDITCSSGEFADSILRIPLIDSWTLYRYRIRVYDATKPTHDITDDHPIPDYNIVADGVTDDYVSLQALLTIAGNGGWGGEVVIPKGYVVAVSETLYPPRYVTITGGGEIKKIGTDTGPLVEIEAIGVTLDNITLTGTKDPDDRNTDDWAVTLDAGNDYLPLTTGTDASGVKVDSWLGNKATIKNCTIKDHAGACVWITGEDVTDVLVEENTILGGRKDGVLIERGSGHVIRNNAIEDNVGCGVYLKPAVVAHEIRNVEITGNRIKISRGISEKYIWAKGWHPYIDLSGQENYTIGHGIVVTSLYDSQFSQIYNSQGITTEITVKDNDILFDLPTADREDKTGTVKNRTQSAALALFCCIGDVEKPGFVTVRNNTMYTNISSLNTDMPLGLYDVRGHTRVNSEGNRLSCLNGATQVGSVDTAIYAANAYCNAPATYTGMSLMFKDSIVGPFRYGITLRGINGFLLDCFVHSLNDDQGGAPLALLGVGNPFMGAWNGTVKGFYMGGDTVIRAGFCKNVVFDSCVFIVDKTVATNKILSLYPTNSGTVLEGLHFINCTVNNLRGYTEPFTAAAAGVTPEPISGSFVWHENTDTTHTIYNRNFVRTEGWVVHCENVTDTASIVTGTVSAANTLSFASTTAAKSDVINWVAMPRSMAERNYNAGAIIRKYDLGGVGEKTYIALLPNGPAWGNDVVPEADAITWREISYVDGATVYAAATDYAVAPCTHVTYGGNYYVAIADSGPWTSAGSKLPTDVAYWKQVTNVGTAKAHSTTANFWANPFLRLLGSGPLKLYTDEADYTSDSPGTFIDCWEIGTRYTAQTFQPFEE